MDESIKEIAIELDFPSLSFFGKYVRLRTGLSPKEYRERLVNGEEDPYAAPSLGRFS